MIPTFSPSVNCVQKLTAVHCRFIIGETLKQKKNSKAHFTSLSCIPTRVPAWPDGTQYLQMSPFSPYLGAPKGKYNYKIVGEILNTGSSWSIPGNLEILHLQDFTLHSIHDILSVTYYCDIKSSIIIKVASLSIHWLVLKHSHVFSLILKKT